MRKLDRPTKKQCLLYVRLDKRAREKTSHILVPLSISVNLWGHTTWNHDIYEDNIGPG